MKDKDYSVKIRYTGSGLGIGIEGMGKINPIECVMIMNQFSSLVLEGNTKEELSVKNASRSASEEVGGTVDLD